ncbi:GGDEF: diguanylate cyclase (GGDEF) domain protein [compost metagenome]
MLVLPETDAAAAAQVAERCRALIRKQRIPHEQSAVEALLTISLGVGTIVPGQQDRALAFIDAVDRLLYRAKQRGRNRFEAGQWLAGEAGTALGGSGEGR